MFRVLFSRVFLNAMEGSLSVVHLFLLISIAGSTIANSVPQVAGRNSRIVGGEVIPIASAPYQVSLQYKAQHMCGGSIISRSFILTAAHCVFQIRLRFLTVRLGTARVTAGGEVIEVSNVKLHPQYNPNNYHFDFALLQLARAINLEPGVKEIIPLPSLNEPVADGSSAFVSGWGETMNSKDSHDFLRGVVVDIINQRHCKAVYSNLSNEMICAGDFDFGGVDACQLSF